MSALPDIFVHQLLSLSMSYSHKKRLELPCIYHTIFVFGEVNFDSNLGFTAKKHRLAVLILCFKRRITLVRRIEKLQFHCSSCTCLSGSSVNFRACAVDPQV